MSRYGTDLAFVHDQGFASFSARATPFLLALLRARGLAGGHVVELGCGGGQLARALLEAGFRVTAVDHSPAFVALARPRAPGARVVQASAFAFKPPPCDAVLAIGEVLGYAGPDGTTAHGRRRLFTSCARALRDGGLLVFDFATPALARSAGRRHFSEGPGWACLVETQATGRRLERRIVTFRERAGGWRREQTTHRLELLDPAELMAALRAAGFAVRRLPGYGSQPMLPGRAALLAVRRRRLSSTSARSKSRP